MKLYLTLLILLLTCSLTYSQKAKHTVFLKNGTIIRGEIIDINPEKGIKIKYSNQIFFFPYNEIDDVNMGKTKQAKPIPEKTQLTGLRNKTTLGILAGNNGSDQKAPLSFTSSIAYHLNPKLSLGLGSGLEFYQETVLPVFIETQYNINSKKTSPFIYAHGGWAFAIDDRESNSMQTFESLGGLRYGTGIGCILWFNSNTGIVLQAGYQFQEIEIHKTESYVQNNSILIDEYKRFALKIGFYFN